MRCSSPSSSSSSSSSEANYFEYLLKGLGQNKRRVEESRLFRKCVGAKLRERRENKINTFAQGGVNVRKNSPVTL
jgi:hypothetical protein